MIHDSLHFAYSQQIHHDLKFSELVFAAESLGKNQKSARKLHCEAFLKALPTLVEKYKGESVQEKDFARFDRALAFLVGKDPSIACETIFKIETVLQKRFCHLRPTLQPITLFGPNNKQAIVPRSSLASPAFESMLADGFAEAVSRQIDFKAMSEGCFDVVANFLKTGACHIEPANLQEVQAFAHLYGLGRLFNCAFGQFISFCADQKSRKDPITSHVKQATSDYLYTLFGVENLPTKEGLSENKLISFLKAFIARNKESISSPAKCNSLQSCSSHLCNNDKFLKEEFLELIFKWASLLFQEDGQNFIQAIQLLHCAAELKNVHAQHGICRLLEMAHGKDSSVWLQKMAEQGWAPAQHWLGMNWEDSWEEYHDEQAFRWYRFAAMQDFVPSQMRLGSFYDVGRGDQKDPQEAVRWYKLAADNGDERAQYVLAFHYECLEEGDHKKEAVHYYQMAAEKGHDTAQIRLANCYLEGRGIEKNCEKGVELLLKVAGKKNLNHSAQYMLGKCYEKGTGVKRDYSEAAKWYRKAADLGWYEALHALGVLHEQGLGVPQDFHAARKVYEEAVQYFNIPSCKRVGEMAELGIGGPKDLSQARQLYTLVAERTDDAGLWRKLIRWYSEGIGGPKDLQKVLNFQALARRTSLY